MSRSLVLIGAPTSAGSYAPGQEAAPRVLRELGLVEALRAAGRDVVDAGNGPLQVWRPDRENPRAMNLADVVEAVQAVGAGVAKAIQADADVLVIGGNCTVALGMMSALTGGPPAGLLYIDRHFDLNTPHSTSDGALDWMGMAHALALPGATPELAFAFGATPLLTPAQLWFAGIDPAAATAFENEQADQLSFTGARAMTSFVSPPSWSQTPWTICLPDHSPSMSISMCSTSPTPRCRRTPTVATSVRHSLS